MLKRTLFITLLLVMVFSLSAFAGEGSDTVGGGKLLPQLRYAYSATEWDTTGVGAFHDWDFGAHDYYLQVNWGVFENLDIFALVGGRSIRMETEAGTLKGSADTAGCLLWGFGVKGTFFRADNGFYVGGGALFTHSRATNFVLSQYLAGAPAGEWDYDLSSYTLTPELHVGYHFKNIGLTPYIGVDYTYSRAVLEYSGGDATLRMDDPVYMFAGIDHYVTDKLYLNFEGRTNFGGGWGMGGGIGYLFDICAKPAPAPAPAPAPVIEPKLEPMSKN
jgi:hypothetical protein